MEIWLVDCPTYMARVSPHTGSPTDIRASNNAIKPYGAGRSAPPTVSGLGFGVGSAAAGHI